MRLGKRCGALGPARGDASEANVDAVYLLQTLGMKMGGEAGADEAYGNRFQDSGPQNPRPGSDGDIRNMNVGGPIEQPDEDVGDIRRPQHLRSPLGGGRLDLVRPDGRVDRPRTDRRHADIRMAILLDQGLGQGTDAKFGGRVEADARLAGVGGRRLDVEDIGIRRLLQVRQRLATHQIGAGQVRVDELVPLRRGRVDEPRPGGHADAGAVDEDVDAAEPVGRFPNQRFDVSPPGARRRSIPITALRRAGSSAAIASSRRSRLRAAATTLMPRAANALTAARPMPWLPPVTMATRGSDVIP